MMTSHSANSLPPPPGRSGLPIIGETLKFLQDPDFANKRCQQYGSIFRTHLFGSPTIYLAGADAVRFVLLLEMKIFAASLVRNYDWNLAADRNPDLEMIPSPRPKDGLQVHFRRKATGSLAEPLLWRIGSTNLIP